MITFKEFLIEVITVPLTKLDRDPAEFAYARKKWKKNPNYRDDNPDPITVKYVDGKYMVINGHHRVVQAEKDGKISIKAKIIK
jgi:hypothetical protein